MFVTEDDASPLEPITAGGITYQAGQETEGQVGGFPARSVTTMGMGTAHPFPEIPGDLKARDGHWARYTLIDVEGEPLLVITGVSALDDDDFAVELRAWT